ncbi:MAG: CRISPR-associated helicase Cas3' [bacterium]|nr:CRISPR-associated helicase Cas3' [bacterium]
MAFFIRMIYSCLVDADYLDTEEFMNRGSWKRGGYESIGALLGRFREYVSPWLEETGGQERICGVRTRILQECMCQGKVLPQGIYTLTVPTGGGKTTASMGFALEHVLAHGMERVIYVIPYTSVIDQNAAVFEKILGEENVIEHHGGITYELEEDECGDLAYKKALAVENWDAPVIVTTAVQFFESLFANKSSKCRKLHNIANSVIIFDEAQTLPLLYLEPCIAAIAQLVKNYRATAVLCTATQPALEKHFQKYIPDLRFLELCSKTEELFRIFERTTIRDVGCQTVEQLAEELKGQSQVLCIVNKRKTAQELYRSVAEEGTYCLTTLLYPADRLRKFEEIRDRLKQGSPCRVIATSLIEAGVDLDFPLVFRQEAGLDSLIQSAGRCNREGKRSRENSYVYSFRLENESSPFAAQGIAAMRETWRRYERINEPAAISFYFQFYRELTGGENLDQKGILRAWEQGLRGSAYPFSSVADMFRLIENDTKQVFIPAEGAEELLEKIEEGTADKNTYRKLGRYGVNVYPEHFRALWDSGCLETVGDRVFVLRDKSQYRGDTGLQMDVETGFGIFI